MDDPFPIYNPTLSSFLRFFSGWKLPLSRQTSFIIEVLRKKGKLSGRILSLFSSNQSQFLATMLVGNNIALVLYGIFMAGLLEPLIYGFLPEIIATDIVVLIIQSLLSTLLVLITAEFLPKSLFLINPDFSLQIFSLPMGIIFIGMYPVVWLIVKISGLFILLFGYKLSEKSLFLDLPILTTISRATSSILKMKKRRKLTRKFSIMRLSSRP